MESHASAARTEVLTPPRAGVLALARRLYQSLDLPISLAVAFILAGIAFVGNGGLQLGPLTLVELVVIGLSAVVIAAALVCVGFEARLHGGLALVGVVALTALTGLSILWSLYPSDSWIEANRTLSYLAAFTAGIAVVRLAHRHWAAVIWGVLLALAAVSIYGLATKVAPGWLAPDEIYARLRKPYGYWNAVGVTAAMGIPLCLWLGTREAPSRELNAIAYPLLGLFIVTILLSYSRGSIIAAIAGLVLWFVFVPLRLRSLALLLCATAAAAIVTTWAFAQNALTDDRVALGAREHAGLKLGLILVVMIVALALAGLAVERRAERRPLSEPTRRRLGMAALATFAVLPVIGLSALAFTNRGIGGTISDRWRDLTHEQATPQNTPGRLIKAGSVRTIYWARALDVWREHRVIGAGAGSFEKAQLRFRKGPAQGRHAHGYIHQTLADLGLVGLGVSLITLIAWLFALRSTLDLRRGRMHAAWMPERTGLAALALVAVVFGVHSALDWTWFVPAVAITGLFTAGWIAGRGPLAIEANGRDPIPPLTALSPALPGRGPVLYRRAAGAVGVLAVAIVAALLVAQPWRADRKGDEALTLASKGNFSGAISAARKAEDLDPLSIDPYIDRAAAQTAAGDATAALGVLQQAVQRAPADPEGWARLGSYYLDQLSQPEKAIPILRAAVFLDPFNQGNRNELLLALRIRDANRRAAAAARRRRVRAAGRARTPRAPAAAATRRSAAPGARKQRTSK